MHVNSIRIELLSNELLHSFIDGILNTECKQCSFLSPLLLKSSCRSSEFVRRERSYGRKISTYCLRASFSTRGYF